MNARRTVGLPRLPQILIPLRYCVDFTIRKHNSESEPAAAGRRASRHTSYCTAYWHTDSSDERTCPKSVVLTIGGKFWSIAERTSIRLPIRRLTKLRRR
jgi:hypothetical protein